MSRRRQAGKQLRRAPFKQQTQIAFRATESGLYQIRLVPWANQARIVDSSHRLCLSSDTAPIHLYGSPGGLFFWVPSGTVEFALRVFGEGEQEGIRAAVCDPSGRIVQEKDNITALHQFLVTLPGRSTGAVWSVKLSPPSTLIIEDHFLLILGIPPLVAASRDALLAPGPQVATP